MAELARRVALALQICQQTKTWWRPPIISSSNSIVVSNPHDSAAPWRGLAGGTSAWRPKFDLRLSGHDSHAKLVRQLGELGVLIWRSSNERYACGSGCPRQARGLTNICSRRRLA
jgi:hypothetical protein